MQQLSTNLLHSLNSSESKTFLVPTQKEIAKTAKIRADIFIAKTLNISRAKAQQLIENHQFLLNNSPLLKSGELLKSGDKIIFKNDLQPAKTTNNNNFKIPILYEDEDLLILNKPAQLIVHRSNLEDTQFSLVDWLKTHNFPLSDIGDSYRAGLVHRLDKGTSGAIVIAKNNATHYHLSAQIQSRVMGRYYLCVIHQALKEPRILDFPIIRHPKHRLKYITATNNPNAKPAKSAFFNLANHKNCALIGAKLFSGRTHQIRVHLKAINRHILGDNFYGYQGNYQGRILLHAHLIYLQHPKTQKHIRIYAPIPLEMQNFLKTHFSLDDFLNNQEILIPLDKLYQNFFA